VESLTESPELPAKLFAEPPLEEVPLDLTPEGVESSDIPSAPVSEPFVRPVLLAELLPDEVDISIEGTGSGESKGSPAAGELDIF
jgi:hypothetical protein